MYCRCKQCKKAKRKGLILGTRRMYIHKYGGWMNVSDYVPYHKYQKGRRPLTKVDVNLM